MSEGPEECIHGISFCTICRTADLRAQLRRGIRGVPTLEARFDSTCPECGGFIQQGERIYRLPAETVFFCESCAVWDLRRRANA